MSLSKKITYSLLLAIAVHGMAAAETVIVTPVSVPSLVRSGNPELAAARYTIDEAAGRMLGAGRLSNPELEFGGKHNHRFKEGGVELGFSQQFPLTDRLEREREVSAAELEAARAEVRDSERLLIAEAREALVKLIILKQQRDVFSQQRQIANELAEFTAKAAERGEGSILDAGQSQLEAQRMIVSLRQLDSQESTETGALKRLLGISPQQQISVGGALPEPSIPQSEMSGKTRPDLIAARVNVKKGQSAVALQQSRRYADLKVGLVAGVERTEDAPEGFENEGIIGVRLSMPLPFWNKNEGGIAEAKATLARQQREVVAISKTIANEIETARAEMEQWMRLAQSIDDELLPLVEKQSDLAERAYREGQGDLQAVFRVREQQIQMAASRLEALLNYHLARVRYEAALGE